MGGIGSKLCETFTYDSLDRLDTVRGNGTLTLDANYDLSGNLSSRSDVGSYTYHATRKHAVITAGSNSYAYDANGNVTTRNGATLGWASYDLPTSLASGGNSASFAYTPDRSRWRQIATTAGVTETTIYVAGIVEKVTKPTITLWKHYVATPTGMGAVYVRRSDGTSDTYYLTTDHLGSTDRILKAATGTVQVAESFDAFGKRRGSDWQGAPSAADLTAISNSTPDGFTGHEMLDGVGLIHMNGRVYDPTVGRFLSVDPIVRDSAASQSWNGYGYVEGRVLSATDPSGWLPTDNLKPNARPRSGWVTSIVVNNSLQTLTKGTDPVTGQEWVMLTLQQWFANVGFVVAHSEFAGRGYTGTIGEASTGGGGGTSGESVNEAVTTAGQQGDTGKCRIENAVADAFGGAVAGATFAFLSGQPGAAMHLAGAGALVAGFTSYVVPSGGMGAFAVATHVGAIALAPSGSSGGSFADVAGAAAEAATPAGPLTIPVGAAAGGVSSAIRPLLGLGRVGSAIIGGHAGGMAAAAGLATSQIIAAVIGCRG